MKLEFFEPSIEDGQVVVRPPQDVVRDGCKEWETTIVGHFVRASMNFHAVKGIAQHLCGCEGLLDAISSDNGFFFFRFLSIDAVEKTLEEGPWHMMNLALDWIVKRVETCGFSNYYIKFVGATLSSSLLETVNNDEYGYSDRRLRKDCCVVEEYLPAGDLRSYIDENREKKLSLKVVIRLALDVSTGLSYLHSLNIVHRNIKPENLLLDKAHRVKISEFGVARIADTYPSHMTQLDETSNYTAPEVLSRAPYNRKCDVYSFGICLWEIYCCDWPYPNHVDWQLREAVVQQNLRPEIPECCPSSLANVMTRCWDANPDNRPEMQEVLSLLMAIDISKGRGMIPCEPSHEGSPAYPTEKKSRGWSFFRMFCGS
ncbi:Serine/threonine-protein kinase HT1 [Morella rubra]|uniref:Serine/threonine-protein kinase HT1 n=1 Tax=Morella rubra TaxID=262757 RepID=A0A6A1VMU5_9ROSI|nr:Serine/threonine-protein kinase HT1 [Morella rubra]